MMNERIKELVKQAGGIYHNDDGDELTPALVDKGLEKFAELIVRECIDIAEQTRYDGKVVAERIKFVFGVEE